MTYETPDFVEIKMDAEIGSYQADYDPPFVHEESEAQAAE